MRIYDNHENKIQKGFLCALTDSSLVLLRGRDTVIVPAKQIGIIKLRRSFGNNVLMGVAISATTFAILGAFTGSTKTGNSWADYLRHTPSEGAHAGFILGSILGGTFGSIIGGTKRKPSFIINSDLAFWKHAMIVLKQYIPNNKQYY